MNLTCCYTIYCTVVFTKEKKPCQGVTFLQSSIPMSHTSQNNSKDIAQVYFIGAGPGDAELLTLKAHRLIGEADLVLYAGSLVPPSSLINAKPTALVVDSAPLTLQECHALMVDCVQRGGMVARVHTGDPSLYGTIQEQARLLEASNIHYAIVPGVTSACAAAAAAGISFTVPEVTQSLVITRLPGRTPMPDCEKLAHFAALRCSIAVYLSAQHVDVLQEELRAVLTDDTPILCAYRVGWPQEQLVWCTLESVVSTVKEFDFTRQTLFLILPGHGAEHGLTQSKLYAADFSHGWRK